MGLTPDQMKSLSVKLGFILIGLAIFGNAEVWGADWVFVGDYNNHHLYYDAQSISRSSKNIFQVTVKDKVSEQLKKQLEKPPNEDLPSYYISIYEFNCKEKIFRILSYQRYSEDGELLQYRPWREEWLIIPNLPDFISLYKIVCK
jgi:hypothetical protein